jgi:hypothetical protein
MNTHKKWIASRVRLGWALLILGILTIIAGIIFELNLTHLPYNFRLVTGLGILFAGGGIGYLVRYIAALKDAQSARRLAIEEQDERSVLIRTRAGNRAFWVSAALVYLGLLWASFASSGSLPALAGDVLWFFLAACVLVPFAVYIAGILLDQRSL